MKKLPLLFLFLTLAFATSCQEKYPDLKDGVYAEFETNQGVFVAKLYNDATPLTVANFVALTDGTNKMVDSTYKGKRFFDGLTFHRVIKDFMIQGGDPVGDGTGSPGYRFPDEIVDTLTFKSKGLLAMANSGPETNGSQFFITLKDTPWLNGRHTIFGEIVMGQEIIDSIGKVETLPGDKPKTPITISKVTIINKGKVKVPYFTEEMEKIETVKKEKETRISKVSENTLKTLTATKSNAETLPSGVQIVFDKKGTGPAPAEGEKVNVNYIGYLANGLLIDTNQLEVAEKYEAVDELAKTNGKYNPVSMDFSKDASLIPGFKEGLLMMKPGDKITLYIPSHLAYGKRGYSTLIPPDSDLIYELEMLPKE